MSCSAKEIDNSIRRIDLSSSLEINPAPAKLSVIGMDFVGAVTSTCLALRGFQVISVLSSPKLQQSASSILFSALVESSLPQLFAQAITEGNLHLSVELVASILSSDISLICDCEHEFKAVNGPKDHLIHLSHSIALALKQKDTSIKPHILAYRFSDSPGFLSGTIIPLLEKLSGKKEGIDFHLCFNPHFMHESTCVSDFQNPLHTVVGSNLSTVAAQIFALYAGLPNPMLQVPLEGAEMLKYMDITLSDFKVSFANEVEQLCPTLQIIIPALKK